MRAQSIVVSAAPPDLGTRLVAEIKDGRRVTVLSRAAWCIYSQATCGCAGLTLEHCAVSTKLHLREPSAAKTGDQLIGILK